MKLEPAIPTPDPEPKGVQAKLLDYIMARRDAEELSRRAKEASKRMHYAEQNLIESMLDGDLQQLKHGNVTYYLRGRCRFSVSRDNIPLFEDWLREHDEEPEDYLVPAVNRTAFSQFLKDYVETYGEGELPEEFHVDTSPAVYVRGWKNQNGGTR